MATHASNQDSPLLSLPAELRNEIYTQVLVGTEDIDISSPTAHTQGALLDVCKQIRKEAAEIYYVENSFSLTTDDKATKRLKKWASKTNGYDVSRIGAVNFKYNLDEIERELEQTQQAYYDNLSWSELECLASEGWHECVRVEAERVAQLAGILISSGFAVPYLTQDESALARMMGVWSGHNKWTVLGIFFEHVEEQFNDLISNWTDERERRVKVRTAVSM